MVQGPAQGTAVRVLVLPVFRRYWLWHGWKEAPAPSTAPKPWQEGESLQEKFRLLVGSIQRWGSQQGDQQWHKLATAPPGTFNHRLFRLAQDVLSRVDPNESFLKVLPQQADVLQFRYPSSLPERLVRRRLRLLAAKAQPFHTSRLRLWAMMLVPQIPLIPLPLPNVTIYFTIWRIISNRNAARGASVLSDALEMLSDLQRLKLAQQLVQLQQEGVQLKPHSWAAQLAADVSRLQQHCQAGLQVSQASAEGSSVHNSSTSGNTSSSNSSSVSGQQLHDLTHSPQPVQQQQQQAVHKAEQSQQQQQQQRQQGLPLPTFIADKELDELVAPKHRLSHFLPESTVEQLVGLYHQPHLLEHYRAARKTCQQHSEAPY